MAGQRAARDRDRPDRGGAPRGDGHHRLAGAGGGDPLLRLAPRGDAGRPGAREVPRGVRRQRLGTFDEYITPGYQGITEIVSSFDLWKKWLEGGPENRVDSRAFVKARLFDAIVGNWDRHQGQWRWARFPDKPLWVPMPEDADQALTRYEGVVIAAGRTMIPRFMRYSGEYPGRLEGLTANNADVTRWFPAESSGRSGRKWRASSRRR